MEKPVFSNQLFQHSINVSPIDFTTHFLPWHIFSKSIPSRYQLVCLRNIEFCQNVFKTIWHASKKSENFVSANKHFIAGFTRANSKIDKSVVNQKLLKLPINLQQSVATWSIHEKDVAMERVGWLFS